MASTAPKIIKTYSDLLTIPSYEDRIEYLKTNSQVGVETFGFNRYLNQKFYTSPEWRRVRNLVIARDYGLDLAHEDHPIFGQILIHHINPISVDDIMLSTDILFNPEYLVCASKATHNLLHYGVESSGQAISEFVDRAPNDTSPWRNIQVEESR